MRTATAPPRARAFLLLGTLIALDSLGGNSIRARLDHSTLRYPFKCMHHPAICPGIVRRISLLFGCAVLLGPAFPQTPGPSVPTTIDLARDAEVMRARERDQELRAARETELMDRDLNDGWIEDASRDRQNPVFLPPLVPVLGAMQSDLPSLPYPATLADFAGETFFMAYGSLQFRLKPAQLRQVERYRAARDQLTAELRSALAEIAKRPSNESSEHTARLAARQEPALRKLEADAESIRAELAAVDEGVALIKLRDSLKPEQSARLGDFFSALMASQFQNGLSLEQRQLLLEIAFESLPDTPGEADAPDSFLPAPARLRWPADATEELVTLWPEFRVLREGLRDELLQQVVHATAAPSAAVRIRQHAALAAQQAPRFDELHRLAERIRDAAAGINWPDPPAASDFPADLVRHVGAALAHKNALQARTQRRFQQFSRELAPTPLKLTFPNNLPVIEVPPAEPAEKPDNKRADLLSRLQKCNKELEDEYRALSAEMETARIALQQYRASLGGETTPSAGKLSAQLAQVHAREENWRRFADYRAAVLRPGLSPAQRRLLFNAALRDLEKQRLQAMD